MAANCEYFFQKSAFLTHLAPSLTGLLLLLLLLASGRGSPVPAGTRPLQQPCGTAPPTDVDLGSVMTSLRDNSQEIAYSAAAFQTYLTEGDNPRVTELEVRVLQTWNVHVENFPLNITKNSLDNVTQVFIADYIYLSKVYIFFKQVRANINNCDTKANKSTGVDRVDGLLTKTQLTLCNVATYLASSGHPMPSDHIPDETDVLNASSPPVNNLPCDNDSDNLRNKVDYVLAGDAAVTASQLRSQTAELLDTLFGHNNSSR